MEEKGLFYFLLMGILSIFCILGIVVFFKNLGQNFWWRWIYLFGGSYLLFDLFAIATGLSFWRNLLYAMFDVSAWYWNFVWGGFIFLGGAVFVLGIRLKVKKINCMRGKFMSQQNIYDNSTFFEGYKKIREKKSNANDLFETPALFSLLPDLQDKTVLDLGCGVGGHCFEFVNGGAKKVVGIDISKKMLEVAEKENHHSKITYLNLPMESLSQISEKFDLVVSSLAIHYVKDFEKLVGDVFNLLNENGLFVFSQEHPLNTCFSEGERWTKDEKGNKLFANISNYSTDGVRESVWFIDGVKKYHRTFSSIINTLVLAGFSIEKLIEPIPTEELLLDFPDHRDLFHKPGFLLVRGRKM